MIHYKKLKDGSFGVIGPTSEIKPNAVVTVTKKDGTTKTERVLKITKPFLSFDGSGEKVIGFIEARATVGRGSLSARGDRAPMGRSCPMCGSRSCSRAWNANDLCDED